MSERRSGHGLATGGQLIGVSVVEGWDSKVEAQRCQGRNTFGEPCSARPVLEGGYCYWHSPKRAAERAANNRKGGQARSNRARARRQYLDGDLSLAEVKGLLSVALKDVLTGDCEPGRAQAAASVARAIAAISEVVDIEERLSALEQAASQKWGA